MVDSVGVDGGSIADFGSGVCEINARPYSRPDSTPAPPKSKLKSSHAILRELGVQNKRPLLQKSVWVNYNIDVGGSKGGLHFGRSLFKKRAFISQTPESNPSLFLWQIIFYGSTMASSMFGGRRGLHFGRSVFV